MKLSELIKNVETAECCADLDMEIDGVSHDSRTTAEGDAFVAISGFESDGHRFIPMAVEKGARVIICSRRPEIDIPYVLVRDCRLALALISCNFFDHPADKMKIFGVTGTNGKTTTTYLLKHLLESALGAKVGLVGTNGNMIGSEFIHSDRTTPESYELQQLFYEMYKAGCTHVVMEVSSHSLVLNRVAGITFEAGLFTNLTQDHLDFHKTMEEYAEAKSGLFKVSKTGWVNADDPWRDKLAGGAACPIQSYGTDKAAFLRAENISVSSVGVKFTASYKGETADVSLAIPGEFSVYNALGVMALGLSAGISLGDCADAMATAQGVKGRMELVPTPDDYTIIIDYSHTPDALENALKALKVGASGRIVALFGCGGDRDRTKRPIMGRIASQGADFVIVTSDNPRTEEPMDIINEILPGVESGNTPYVTIPDRVEAIKWAIDKHMPGDVILLAGKGHEDYQEIGKTKIHMDEREIVAEHIKETENGSAV